jgi:PAS domain S-box-containing protein
MSGSPSLSLSELIDLEELQSIQDSFARAAGISSVILSPEGDPLTKFTNPTGFCALIQSTGKGKERCFRSFMEMGKIALGSEEPEIFYCFVDGGHFVAPIIINGEHKGTMFAGQFIPEKFSPEQLQNLEKIAPEIGIDPKMLVKEAGELRVVGEDVVRNYSSLLFKIVETIARRGAQAAELSRVNDALQRAHDGLEMRVQERTAELAEANKELEQEVAERKLAEEALRLHAAMIDNVTEGVCLIGLDDHLIKWTNGKLTRMFGYDPGAMIGKHVDIVNALTERTPTKTWISIVDVLKETGEWHGEVRNIKRDGTHFWCSANVSLFDHPEYGNVLISAYADITERKKMEETLRIAHENTKTILEKAPFGVVVIGRDRKIKWVNDTALKMAGVENTDIMLGKNCGEYLCPAQQKECPILDKGQRVDNSERIFRRNDGKEIPIIKTVIEINMGGEAVLLETFVDITERKRIEENLRKKQSAEEAYTDILMVASRTIDLNTIVTEGLANLMKYTDSPMGVVYLYKRDTKTLLPVVARGAADMVAEQSFLCGEGIVGETAAKKEMVVATGLADTIYKIPSGDGAVLPDTIIGTPILFKNALIGVILTCHSKGATPELTDFIKRVTGQVAVAINNANTYRETQEMAAELKSERDKLEITSLELAAASRIKSEFLANMSHELRTPLNSIIGFSEILHDGVFGPVNEKQAKYVNNVLVSGKHLLQLINDILDLSKVEAGKIELVYEDFSVSEAINEVMALTASIAAKKCIVVDLSVDEGLTAIHADEGKIKQILYNLLSNAIKFTPEHGSVTVGARQRGAMVEISVTDTGIGISEADQKKLFQPFMQADATTSREYGGTGLGLSLVKKFSELHGGGNA